MLQKHASKQPRVISKWILPISLAILSAKTLAQTGPSFDCRMARGQIERTVCANSDLSRLDQSLAAIYKKALASPTASTEIHNSQHGWLQARSGICIAPADWAASFSRPIAPNLTDCLTTLYKQRIKELEDGNPSSFSMYWRAESKTAYSITGDILLSSSRITMAGGQNLQISVVKRLPRTAAMDDPGFDQADTLELFKVLNARPLQLINKNDLCGPDHAPTFLVLAKKDTNLSMAVFQGNMEPQWERSFISNTRDLCGTFGFSKSNASH